MHCRQLKALLQDRDDEQLTVTVTPATAGDTQPQSRDVTLFLSSVVCRGCIAAAFSAPLHGVSHDRFP
jgi:hypothetical protein